MSRRRTPLTSPLARLGITRRAVADARDQVAPADVSVAIDGGAVHDGGSRAVAAALVEAVEETFTVTISNDYGEAAAFDLFALGVDTNAGTPASDWGGPVVLADGATVDVEVSLTPDAAGAVAVPFTFDHEAFAGTQLASGIELNIGSGSGSYERYRRTWASGTVEYQHDDAWTLVAWVRPVLGVVGRLWSLNTSSGTSGPRVQVGATGVVTWGHKASSTWTLQAVTAAAALVDGEDAFMVVHWHGGVSGSYVRVNGAEIASGADPANTGTPGALTYSTLYSEGWGGISNTLEPYKGRIGGAYLFPGEATAEQIRAAFLRTTPTGVDAGVNWVGADASSTPDVAGGAPYAGANTESGDVLTDYAPRRPYAGGLLVSPSTFAATATGTAAPA